MRHIGIDPGLSGAIAVITETPQQISLQIHDMPTMTVDRNGKAKRQVSANELADLLRSCAGKDCHVYVERVSAMAAALSALACPPFCCWVRQQPLAPPLPPCIDTGCKRILWMPCVV